MKRIHTVFGSVLAACAGLAAASASAASAFPTTLLDNGTTFADSVYTGAPGGGLDGAVGSEWGGIGGQIVTFDFGLDRVANGIGADFTVYEKKGGGVEFDIITVSVSLDGLVFTDVTTSETTYVAIVGDALHGSASFARSYDLGVMALARYVRIDGDGTSAGSGATGFDLDGIGAVYLASVPAPAALPLMLGGLAMIAGVARKRKQA